MKAFQIIYSAFYYYKLYQCILINISAHFFQIDFCYNFVFRCLKTFPTFYSIDIIVLNYSHHLFISPTGSPWPQIDQWTKMSLGDDNKSSNSQVSFIFFLFVCECIENHSWFCPQIVQRPSIALTTIWNKTNHADRDLNDVRWRERGSGLETDNYSRLRKEKTVMRCKFAQTWKIVGHVLKWVVVWNGHADSSSIWTERVFHLRSALHRAISTIF